MKLSPSEEKIMAAFDRKKIKEMTVEDVASVIYKDRIWPENWSHSASAIMRNLIIKTASSTKKVKRITPIGRGHIAKYALCSGRKLR